MSDDDFRARGVTSPYNTPPVTAVAVAGRRYPHEKDDKSEKARHGSRHSAKPLRQIDDAVTITHTDEEELPAERYETVEPRDTVELSLDTLRALISRDFPSEIRQQLNYFAPIGDLTQSAYFLDILEQRGIAFVTWPNTLTLRQAIERASRA